MLNIPPKRFFFFVLVVPLLLFLVWYSLHTSSEQTPEEKVAAVAHAVQIQKMTAALETVNKGDILERSGWEGSYPLVVVVSNFRNNERHDIIHYQALGAPTLNMTVGSLAYRVVKVYRVDTPEWKEKVQQFVKQK